LVDAASYERGERKGLMNLARRLLTEPGIITPEPVPVSPAGTPTPKFEPVELSTSTTSVAVTTAGAVGAITALAASDSVARVSFLDLGSQGLVASDSLAPGAPANSTTGPSGNSSIPPEAPRATPPTAAPVADTPYAWSVYDEKGNQGYLNLYNIPSVAPNQALQVWVKPLDSSEYRPVGEVPAQFYGKSGAVSYALPVGTATPSEVLITLEPRGSQAPQKPTGPVVLRGP
ncbi:MAG: anti-sigma factor, partial [Opitutaceae bacterium]